MDKKNLAIVKNFISLVHENARCVAVSNPAAYAAGRYTVVRADDVEAMEKIAAGGNLLLSLRRVKENINPDAGAAMNRTVFSEDAALTPFENKWSSWIPVYISAARPEDRKERVAEILARMAQIGIKDPVTYNCGTSATVLYGFDDLVPADGFIRVTRLFFPFVAPHDTSGMNVVLVPGFGETGNDGYSYKGHTGENNSIIALQMQLDCDLKMAPKKAKWNKVPGGYRIRADFNARLYPDGIWRGHADNAFRTPVIQDKATGRIGTWGQDFERLLVETQAQDVMLHSEEHADPVPVVRSGEQRFMRRMAGEEIIEDMKKRQKPKFIPTGFKAIDDVTGGLAMGSLNIISGFTGGAKSTVASQMLLNMVERGWKGLLFSGEQSNWMTFEIIMKQAAGNNGLKDDPDNQVNKVVKDDVQQKIARWFRGRLEFFNNEYGADLDAILSAAIDENAAFVPHVIVLDNLMVMDFSSEKDKYLKQEAIVKKLKDFANRTGICVVLVAHSKKNSNSLISIEDVLGSSEITNFADTVCCVYRNNDIFKKAYSERYKKDKKQDNDEFIEQKFGSATNIISLLKSRSVGIQNDEYCGVWYEAGSKRMLNTATESATMHFGWDVDFTVSPYTEPEAADVDTAAIDFDTDGAAEMMAAFEAL